MERKIYRFGKKQKLSGVVTHVWMAYTQRVCLTKAKIGCIFYKKVSSVSFVFLFLCMILLL